LISGDDELMVRTGVLSSGLVVIVREEAADEARVA
jgi:hypothetical protein